MQFVRTAQFKHRHFLALSTEDGGPPGPRVRSTCTSYFDFGDLHFHLICVCSTLTLTFHEAQTVLDCSWWTITGFNPMTVTSSIYS